MMIIHVIDIETTGLKGFPHDHVVSIGITEVDTERQSIREIYDEIVGHDIFKWGEKQKRAWIFENTDLKLEDIRSGKDIQTVVDEVQLLLTNKKVTSYNTAFDLDRFLYLKPWYLSDVIKERKPCIMLSAKDYCKLPSKNGYDDYKYPKLVEAFAMLDCKMSLGGHRALADALMASQVLLRLIEEGYYKL